MRSTLIFVRRLLWRAFAFSVILAAVGLSVARLLLANAAEYRLDVQGWAEQRVGRPVRIGSLEARWFGAAPELILKDVRLLHAESESETLRFSEARVAVEPLPLLASGRIVPREVTLVGARLALTRQPDGAFEVAGMAAMPGAGGGGDDITKLLLSSGRLGLRDGEILWEDRLAGTPPIRFTGIRVDIANHGARHRARAEMEIAGNPASSLVVAADLRGDPSRAAAWYGDIYVRARAFYLQRMLGYRLPEGYAVRGGLADWDLWSRWERGRLDRLQGEISAEGVRLAARAEVALDALSGVLDWRRQGQGWRLDVARFRLSRAGRAWPESAFSVALDSVDDRQLRAGFGYLDVTDLVALLRATPLADPHQLETLDAIDPGGEVRAVRLRVALDGEVPDWSAKAVFRDLSLQASGRWPGVDGLSGVVRASQDQGTVELDSSGLVVDLPRLFPEALPAARAAGQVDWWRTRAGWVFAAGDLRAGNEDIVTRSRLRVEVPSGSAPFVDMQVDFADAPVPRARHYLPRGIMSSRLTAWLDQGLAGGRVTQGAMLLRGPVDRFPYRDYSGAFEVLFGVEDAVIDYRDGWPRAEEVTAEVRFERDRMQIRAYEGAMLESELGPVEITSAPLGKSPVRIRGPVNGPYRDLLRMLRETPLADRLGEPIAGFHASGRGRSEVDLSIPVRHGGRMEVEGTVFLRDAALAMERQKLTLSRLNGDLHFTRTGLYAKDARAEVLGSDVRLDLARVGGDGQPKGMRVTARGEVPVATIAKRYPLDVLSYAEGSTDWKLQLTFPPGAGGAKTGRGINLRLESDLQGVSINLPSPMAKPADRPRQFVLTSMLGKAEQQFNFGLGENLRGAFLVVGAGEARRLRGDIRLGGQSAELPPVDGARLSGNLDELDVAPWLALFGEVDEARAEDALPLNRIDLRVGRLLGLGKPMTQVKLDVTSTAEAWQGEIDSDLLSGNLRLPHRWRSDGSPLELDLEYLRLVFGGVDDAGETEMAEGHDPKELPGIDLKAKRLLWGDHDLGQLSARTRRIEDGLLLERIEIASPRVTLDGDGAWRVDASGQRSELRLRADFEDLGKTLKRLGFASGMKDAGAHIDAVWNWDGGLPEVSLDKLQGRLRGKLGKGRILGVEPGVGRALGLVSLSTLQRRLTLDFSDLFKKGLAFDRIEGSFNFEQGDAYTNDLLLDGPSGRIEIAGRTGLVARDYDQTVTVTPRSSTTLPVAGALAGGPLVGAAVLVAQQLLGGEVDKITRYEYAVTGSWDDPQIERTDQGVMRPLSGLIEGGKKVLQSGADLISGKGNGRPDAAEHDQHYSDILGE